MLALLSACGDAYSLLSPAVQVITEMDVYPDSAAPGAKSVVALIRTAPREGTLLTGFEFGPGITLDESSLGGLRAGCTRPSVAAAFDLTGRRPEEFLPICLDLTIAPDAPTGTRRVQMEVDSDGEPVLAEEDSFFVLSSPAESAMLSPRRLTTGAPPCPSGGLR